MGGREQLQPSLAATAWKENQNKRSQMEDESELAGILGFEERPLVSADFVNDTRSGIVDGPATMVVDGNMLKVLCWYDNEYGYVFRMAELAAKVADSLTPTESSAT